MTDTKTPSSCGCVWQDFTSLGANWNLIPEREPQRKVTLVKKHLALVLSILLLIPLFSGCSSSETPEPQTEPRLYDSRLNIALGGAPTNLDIMVNTADDSSVIAYGSIFEQLVALNNKSEPVPELCTHWEISDDSRVYTYYLRKGIKFHNGKEMKAADVIASMNRWIDQAANAQSLVGDARFEEVDEYTVRITMEHGTPYLNLMIGGLGQHAVIMPKEVVEAAGEGVVTEYIGTGPYKFAEWAENQYVKLVKFEDYQPYGTEGDYSGWAGYKGAYYDEVYFYFPGDVATIAAGIQTGEYDASTALSADYFNTFANNPNYKIVEAEADLPALIFNKKEGWGANPKFRQAMAALLDCNDIMYAAYGDEAFYNLYSSYMFKSQATWYTEAGSEYYNQANPDKAKALFAEAGFTPNDTFILLCASDSQDFYSMAIVIQSQMRAIGLNCELLVYDWATFVDVRNNQPDKYHAFITSFSAKVLPNMNLFLSPSWAGWCTDPRIVEDLARIGSETDLAAAQQIWYDLQEYMWAESLPIIKFGNSMVWGVTTAKMEGAEIFERFVWVNSRIKN